MNDNEDIITRVFLKPDYNTRTFETRLLFIKEIFSNTFDRDDIMGRCILYKLDKNTEAYQSNLSKIADDLKEKNPVAVLTGMKKFK